MIKKTTIKRINIVFDIKTKQNQIKMDKIKKKQSKKNPKQIKLSKRKMIII
jgi:hypothetical protein